MNIIHEVEDELQRATIKFPTWPTDPLHAVAILGEEFGELTKAMLQLTYEPHKTTAADVRAEAIQTAAMALRLAMSLDVYKYQPSEQHSQTALDTTDGQSLAEYAVTWLLRRMKEDPRLAYLIGPGSESFDRLTAAGAAIAREEVDIFREEVLSTLETCPVPPKGKLGAVIDPELLERIRVYDDDVHDINSQGDLDMLINHFVGRGLAVAEAERDTQTGELF